jgi:tetratricopeptide (TPR) repeat protein
MTRRTWSWNVARIFLVFIAAVAVQGLSVREGVCSEGRAADKSSSAPNDAAALEKAIYQNVKSLEYSDQVARDFVAMVRPWKCEALCGKLRQAAEDVKQKKITRSQYAQVEEEVVRRLAQTVRNEVAGKAKNFDLAQIVREKKACCLGYSQLFYVLGNSVGLTVQGLCIVGHSGGSLPRGEGHVACRVDLADGKTLQVDLTLHDCVSTGFLFTEAYKKEGNFWQLKTQENRLHIHPRIQLENRRGLVAYIYGNRGDAYRAVGNLARAISDYTKAIEIRPTYVEAYNCRGIAHAKSGKTAEAISDFTKVIELESKCAEAYSNRGSTYFTSGKLSRAISDCTKAIELDPKYGMAYSNRGMAYAVSGRLSEAVADCTKAIELDPKSAEAYGNRAVAYAKSSQLTAAIMDCTKAIELNSKMANPYTLRGALRARLGETEEAKKDLRKAVELNPGLREMVKEIADHLGLEL